MFPCLVDLLCLNSIDNACFDFYFYFYTLFLLPLHITDPSPLFIRNHHSCASCNHFSPLHFLSPFHNHPRHPSINHQPPSKQPCTSYTPVTITASFCSSFPWIFIIKPAALVCHFCHHRVLQTCCLTFQSHRHPNTIPTTLQLPQTQLLRSQPSYPTPSLFFNRNHCFEFMYPVSSARVL